MKKMYGITFIITILLTFFLMMYIDKGWTLLALINAASISSLILIITGGFLYVFSAGFFTGIAHSFRRFYKRTSKTWQMLEEPDGDDYHSQTHSVPIKRPLLVTGSALFVLTLCVSFYLV